MNDYSGVIWEWIAGIILLAVLFMLVRPGAPAAGAIRDVSNTLATLIGTATGIHPANVTNPGDYVVLNPKNPLPA